MVKPGGLSPARLAGYFVFFLSFTVYLFTLAPEVTFWDSGELIFGAASLGLPHPPAYPLFCILGRGFSFIPLGNVAYRVNLLSALFGSSAVYMLYRVIKELGEGVGNAEWAACGMALAFAFFGSFWGVSVVAEVYTLNAFLIASILHLLVRHEKGGSLSHLLASAFVTGLALANHQSVAFFLPAYAAYLLLSGRNYKRPKRIVLAISLFLFGYSTILYLPLRGSARPPLDLGDPVTLGNFAWLIKWPEYINTAAWVWNKFSALKGERAVILIASAVVLAVLAVIFRRKGFLFMSAVAALVYFAGIKALTYGTESAEKWGLPAKFYIPVVLFIMPVAAAAFFGIFRPRPGRKAAGGLPALVLGAVMAAVSIGEAAYGCRAVDNSRNFFAYDFASNMLKSVKTGGALFGWGDNGVFPVWYLQGVERYREDVFYMHTELLSYGWYMADRQAGLFRKYGIRYIPPARLTDVESNVPIMKFELESVTPTYFDYSAAVQLKVPWERLKPQGLVHMTGAGEPVPIGGIWEKYVLRGAYDGTTNKAFATEGVLDIYAWESVVWAQQAYNEGRLAEALKAYEFAKLFGMKDANLDNWAIDIERKLKQGAIK